MPIEDGATFAQQFFRGIGEGSRDEGFFNNTFPNIPSRYIDTVGREGEADSKSNFIPVGSVRSKFIPSKSNACRGAAQRLFLHNVEEMTTTAPIMLSVIYKPRSSYFTSMGCYIASLAELAKP